MQWYVAGGSGDGWRTVEHEPGLRTTEREPESGGRLVGDTQREREVGEEIDVG